MSMDFTSRYEALGMAYPDPQTMCRGECEGTGWYPERDQSTPGWQRAHAQACSLRGRVVSLFRYRRARRTKLIADLKWAVRRCDGWHFIKCGDCGGTGKAR